LRVYEIPEATKTSSGRVIQNLFEIDKDDNVKAYIKIEDLTDEEFINNNYIVFCTKNGMIKKTQVEQYSRPRSNGINAITINEGDQLIEVKLTNGTNEILIANANGRAIRFPEEKVRPMGRTAAGVRGMKLDGGNDRVVGMITVDPMDPDSSVLVLSEKGNGKRSALEDYRITNRGGKGVKTMSITDKTGKLVTIKSVTEREDLVITTLDGIVIRVGMSGIRVMGRATQGVKIIRLDKGESIADVTVIDGNEDEEEE
jgi:DNA gyrase subunit A